MRGQGLFRGAMSGISRWLGPLVNSLKKEAVLNLGSAPDKPKLAINKWVYLLGKCSDQYENGALE